MYKRLTRSRIHAELASPAYLGLGIIYRIILPCINVWRAPEFTRISHPPPTCGWELFKY